MTNAVIALNGNPVRSLTLRVAPIGPWVADVELTEAPALSGRVQLTIGAAKLSGTIVAEQASSFGLSFGARIVGGAGGWGSMLPRKGYHNDAGIQARLVAYDAASEAGEVLGGLWQPATVRLGVDFARAFATASSTLEVAAGGMPWWVNFAGETEVGLRSSTVLTSADVELLDFDEANQIAMLAIDRPDRVLPGAVLNDSRLGGARTVRDVELVARGNEPLRASVWCGGSDLEAGRLPGLLRRITERVNEGRLWGLYRYRVVSVAADKRLDLQAVREAAGLPDLRAISQWGGLPGLSASPAPGSEVLVQFVDGDPGQAVVASYGAPGTPAFQPTALVVGGTEGLPAARQGDAVEVLLPPGNFVGTITISGVPQAATGVVSWLVPKADGTIVGGSGRVRVAS